jgi:SpoIIAA-like
VGWPARQVGGACRAEGDPHNRQKGKSKMSVELKELNGGRLLEARLTGKLAREDYDRFVPAVERLVQQHGKIRMLVEMHDFHGWTAGALWEDIKFDVKHFRDIECLAIIGETQWEKGMAAFCRPFTTATIRYFDHLKGNEARAWINSSDKKV